MKGKLAVLVLAVCVGTAGCPATQVRKLDDRLDELTKAKQAAAQRGQSATGADGELVALAKSASAQAKTAPDPEERIGLYRVAAVAAWEAGQAGESLLPGITEAGIKACDSEGDNAAPQDCSLIRLAGPLSAQDALARQLAGFQKKLATAKPALLPSADLAPIQSLFGGFEGQFGKVSAIRHSMNRLDVPDDLKIQTDTQRLIIFCNALKAWALTADVDGTAMADFTAMERRKTKMADALEASGGAPDCAVAPSMLTSATGPR